MFTVYIIFSRKYSKTYIGLDARFLSHNHLAIKSFTVRFRPWEIIHTENFEIKSEALKREKTLKGGQGRKFIKDLLKSKEGSYPPKADAGASGTRCLPVYRQAGCSRYKERERGHLASIFPSDWSNLFKTCRRCS